MKSIYAIRQSERIDRYFLFKDTLVEILKETKTHAIVVIKSVPSDKRDASLLEGTTLAVEKLNLKDVTVDVRKQKALKAMREIDEKIAELLAERKEHEISYNV